MQINRLFEIVYILMNKKSTTAKDLSEHFEVSKRTIYRDLETLCQSGIPIYTTKGKGGGIGLMEHFVLNKSVLTIQEQNDILSALQGLKATSYAETDHVLTKLSSLFGNSNEDWIEVDFSNWSNNDEDKLKFHQLKDAILKHKLIEFRYYNSYGGESDRRIEPRKLVFKGQSWYLLGYCRTKNGMRHFKISRIKSLLLLEEEFEPTSYEPMSEKTENSNSNPIVSLVMRVDASMAFRIFDEFPADAIKKENDGSYLINTQLQSGGWLTGYLMSYEDKIEIMEPVEIRDQLIEKYKKALFKYDIQVSD